MKNLPLRIVEVIVLGGIAVAFIAPVFAPSDESSAPQQSHQLPLQKQQPDPA
jgi:hypothetical protein